ncbi:Uncharacterised protein [Mycobacteroides abscessus subsp. abscessus]|nr:Uncharacterised protein [Mycobacteroides abscessus subsp. abscessus]
MDEPGSAVARFFAKDAKLGTMCRAKSAITNDGTLTTSAPTQNASKFCTGRGREITTRIKPSSTGFSDIKNAKPNNSRHISLTLPRLLANDISYQISPNYTGRVQ